MQRPDDTEDYVMFDGSYYKVTAGDRVWMFNNGGWVRSAKEPDDLIEKKRVSRPSVRVSCKKRPPNKDRVLQAIEMYGARNLYELQKDTGMDASSIHYAAKDLCTSGTLEYKDGYYSKPKAQIDLFMIAPVV